MWFYSTFSWWRSSRSDQSTRRNSRCDPTALTHWENMSCAALSYNSFPKLPEQFPHLIPSTSLIRGGDMLSSPSMCAHCSTHMHQKQNLPKNTFRHICASLLPHSEMFIFFIFESGLSGGSLTLLDLLSPLHTSCTCCGWLVTTVLHVGFHPEKVFDVEVWLQDDILTAYCNTICSTSGLWQQHFNSQGWSKPGEPYLLEENNKIKTCIQPY